MMTEEQATELGRRAVAAGLNMMAGMMIRNDKCDIRIERVYDDEILYSGAYGEAMYVDEAKKDFWPDFRDPATLGCLRAQVVALVPGAVEVALSRLFSATMPCTHSVMWRDSRGVTMRQMQFALTWDERWSVEALVACLEAAKAGELCP